MSSTWLREYLCASFMIGTFTLALGSVSPLR